MYLNLWIGNRWLFNSSEFTSRNLSNTCGQIPTEIATMTNPKLVVSLGCVELYSGSQCGGSSIQILNTYVTRSLPALGFHVSPRSFSHCNSKCVKNPNFRNAIGKVVSETVPDFSGVRLTLASGKEIVINTK